MKKFLILLAFGLTMLSCAEHKQKINSYTIQTKDDDGLELLLYYYTFVQPDGTYAYTSSTTPITNFSNVTWESSASNPIETMDQAAINEIEVVDAEVVSPEADTDQGDFASDEAGDSGDSGDSSSDGGSDGGDGGGGGE